MPINLSICGQAYHRVFSYVEQGEYREITTPGGAALLAKLLGHTQGPLGEGYRKEHAELRYFTDGEAKQSHYGVVRRMGFTAGETRFLAKGASKRLLVWDEGLAPVEIPAQHGAILWASHRVLPNREVFAPIAGQTLLLIDADVLRASGAMISKQISWERTASELVWQLQHNPALSYLMKAKGILVAFAEDGAVFIRQDQGGSKASLTLAHGGGEGTLRRKLRGVHDDAFLLMTVALAKQRSNGAVDVGAVLHGAEALLDVGYTIEGLAQSQYPQPEPLATAVGSYDIPTGGDLSAFDTWCITQSLSNRRIFDIAFDYVMEGAKAIEGLPKLSFGGLTTIDRREIEAFQNIRNLILGYANSNAVKPLSIAVFGSPGSGKSFGVTQIAKSVLPGKVEKVEFNVSQLTGFSDLGAAFQKVRDCILRGKLPLVFFDEFDSDRDGIALGWLKSFLMPMQDGAFKDESGEHPLGKCILVFAGGTAASFEAFSQPMLSGSPEAAQAFRSIKGPDFISRLKGTINILGQNPNQAGDHSYILRRALLLRSLLGRKLKIGEGRAPVSPNILWAMLLVPQYKHGARSMEAILDMSSLEGNVWEPVSLPFYSQLALHVDADAFIRLVLREVILNSYNERLAKAIHEDYCKQMQAAGHGQHVSVVPWEASSNQDSCRQQAASFPEKLRAIGYSYDAGDTPFPSVEKWTKREAQSLAENEHIRWMEEKRAAGFTYAPLSQGVELAKKSLSPKEWKALSEEEKTNLAIQKLRAEKKHHLLVPYEELPPEEQQKDLNVAENIIPLLQSIGLRVYRQV